MLVQRGSGPPLVFIPGVQGRWEWMEPAVAALSKHCRVVTDSLPGDTGSSAQASRVRGFDQYDAWIDGLIERSGHQHVAVCGVSFGGLIAVHYAARRPERVSALIVVSTPSPRWTPNCRIEWYLRAPRLLSPVFALSSPFRLYPEIRAAFPKLLHRGRFALHHLYRVTRYPFAPTRMADRVRLMATVDMPAACAGIRAPTLIVTGTEGLDKVVPVTSTREYQRLIPGSVYAEIPGTGHIGLVTKPDQFAATVASFATRHRNSPPVAMGVSA